MANILSLPMPSNDADAETVGDYLRALLLRLWEEGERFSGKHPFGNSGWQYDVYAALVAAKVVSGKLDEEGYITSCDEHRADKLITAAISELGKSEAA